MARDEATPQRFGTQFKTVDGQISILPIEDEQHVDERRTRYLLPPMVELVVLKPLKLKRLQTSIDNLLTSMLHASGVQTRGSQV